MRKGRPTRIVGALVVAGALSAASAGTAGAATTLTLTPTAGDFGSVKVGNGSPPKAFKLEIACDVFACGASFNPAPSSSNAEFPIINLCPTTISYLNFFVGEDDPICYIVARFTPTSTGAKSATISTGSGGPTATLTGTGIAPDPPPVVQTAGKCKRGGKKSATAAKKKRGCKKRKKK